MFIFRYFFLFSLFVSVAFAQTGWETVFERSGYKSTSTYAQTDEYFTHLSKISGAVKYETFGISPQGRELKVFLVSKDTAFTPDAAKRSGKPVLFIINGIHSGEIEGKDASMIFLREMLVDGKHREIFDNVNIVLVPIFSVDGHERSSPYNRINQNGPENMGWRVTAQNLNLNRDWTKAEAPEMQAMIKLYNAWDPDMVMDNHTTNGADYQYTVSYGLEYFPSLANNLVTLIRKDFLPFLYEKVEGAGWLMSPYVSFKNNKVSDGIVEWASSPRFTNGYSASRNRISFLVETHMMKPYKDRVFGTYECIKAAALFLSINGKEVIEANKSADGSVRAFTGENARWVPIKFVLRDSTTKKFHFKGIEAVTEKSTVSGAEKTVYTGKKVEFDIPHYDDVYVADSILLPAGYIIPKEYKNIAEKLALHGIKVEEVKRDEKAKVEVTTFRDFKFAERPFEGRTRVSYRYDTETMEMTVPAGSFYVDSRQKTFKLIATLLEPKSDDSYVSWGYFNQIFEMKEYYEDYVMERVALEMFEKDPALKAEFEQKVASDEKFRNDPDARLSWLYRRSPYFDKKYCVYPVLRVME